MTEPLSALLDLLDLEPLEVNIYRGRNRDLGTGRVFGGQVFAQALVAARRTVDGPREAHSAHGYFILPGDLAAPIVYFVDRLRDGASFTTRRVTAIQHGQAIFNLSASFHIIEKGFSHQPVMPQVPAPEELQPELHLLREMADRIPEALRPVLTQERPIDFRPVTPLDLFDPEKSEPVRRVWFRAIGTLPDDQWVHQRGARVRLGLRPPSHGTPATRRIVSRAGTATRFARSFRLAAPSLPRGRLAALLDGQPGDGRRERLCSRRDLLAGRRPRGVDRAGRPAALASPDITDWRAQ